MKNPSKAFIFPIVLIVIAIALIGGGLEAYHRSKERSIGGDQASSAATTKTTLNGRAATGQFAPAASSTSSASVSNPSPTTMGLTAKSAVHLTSLEPSSGPTGGEVTIRGTGFEPTGNTIFFGGHTISTVEEKDGALTFDVPDQLNNCTKTYCTATIIYVNPGEYPIIVSNSNGTSNSLEFTVTSSDSSR